MDPRRQRIGEPYSPYNNAHYRPVPSNNNNNNIPLSSLRDELDDSDSFELPSVIHASDQRHHEQNHNHTAIDGFSRPRETARQEMASLVDILDDVSISAPRGGGGGSGYDDMDSMEESYESTATAVHQRQERRRNQIPASVVVRQQEQEDAMVLNAVVARIQQKCVENDTSKEIRYVRDPSEAAIAELHAADLQRRRNPRVVTIDENRTFVGREHLNYETLPIGMLDLIASHLLKQPMSMQMEMFYDLIRYNSRILLTESDCRTDSREAVSKFEGSTRPFVTTQATLRAWREEIIGPWAQRRMETLDFLVEREGTTRLVPPPPLLLENIAGPTKKLMFDVYRLDDSFYVFCFFSYEKTPTTTTPARPPNAQCQCQYLGFLYGQSDQSHQMDLAVRACASDMLQLSVANEAESAAAAAAAADELPPD